MRIGLYSAEDDGVLNEVPGGVPQRTCPGDVSHDEAPRAEAPP
jgi:hypothetical protein